MSDLNKGEKFCLKWNEFESNVSHAFQDLREGRDFLDVTLACEDSQIEAHKVILSASSKFFHSILKKNPHQHPLLYLKGVKIEDLQSIIDFLYVGEVNVAQENLNSFLTVAEELQIKGLTQNKSANTQNNHFKNQQKNLSSHKSNAFRLNQERETNTDDDEIVEVPAKERRTNFADNHEITEVKEEEYSGEQSHTVEDFSSENYSNYEDENFGLATQSSENVYDENQDMDLLVAEAMLKDPATNEWRCNYCHKSHKDKARIKRHVEVHFPGQVHFCPHCQKQCHTRNSLRVHISEYHKKNMSF